jgi:hypothetical protein
MSCMLDALQSLITHFHNLPYCCKKLQMPDMHLSSANANSCDTTVVTSYLHGQAHCSCAYNVALAI